MRAAPAAVALAAAAALLLVVPAGGADNAFLKKYKRQPAQPMKKPQEWFEVGALDPASPAGARKKLDPKFQEYFIGWSMTKNVTQPPPPPDAHVADSGARELQSGTCTPYSTANGYYSGGLPAPPPQYSGTYTGTPTTYQLVCNSGYYPVGGSYQCYVSQNCGNNCYDGCCSTACCSYGQQSADADCCDDFYSVRLFFPVATGNCK